MLPVIHGVIEWFLEDNQCSTNFKHQSILIRGLNNFFDQLNTSQAIPGLWLILIGFLHS